MQSTTVRASKVLTHLTVNLVTTSVRSWSTAGLCCVDGCSGLDVKYALKMFMH